MDEGSPPSPGHASWTVRVARSREGRGRDFKRRAALSQQRIEDEGAFLTWRGDRITLGIETAFRSRILGRTWHRRAVRLRQLRRRCRNRGRPGRRLKRSGPTAGRERQGERKQGAEREHAHNSAHSRASGNPVLRPRCREDERTCKRGVFQTRPPKASPAKSITSQRRGDIVSNQSCRCVTLSCRAV